MVNVRANGMVKGRVIDMVKGKNRPPSRIRYEKTHPVIAIRVDEETAERLKDLARESGKSLATLIKENLDLQEDEYTEAWSKGYDEGRKKHQIWYYCAVCGKRMNMTPSGNDHKALISYMKEHGWGHQACHSA
jgi:predicted DNA binding CopG/RHH family protein